MSYHDDIMAKAYRIRDLAARLRGKETAGYKGWNQESDRKAGAARWASRYAGLPRHFELFTRGRPDALSEMRTPLAEASRKLAAAGPNTDKIAGQLWGFEGLAAGNLKQRFLSKFQLSTLNQQYLIAELSRTLETTERVLLESRAAVSSIADSTITSLEKALADEPFSEALKFALSLVSITTALSVAKVAGASLKSVVIPQAITATNTVNDLKVTVNVGGTTADDIVSNMLTAMYRVQTEMISSDTELARKIAECIDELGQLRATNPTELVPQRPEITDGRIRDQVYGPKPI